MHLDEERKSSDLNFYWTTAFTLLYISIVFLIIFLLFYNYTNPNFVENVYPPSTFPLPLLIRGKLTGSSLILIFVFLFPALAFFAYGIYKTARDESNTFNEIIVQALKFRISRTHVSALAKFVGFITFFGILMIIPVLIGYSIQDIMNFIITFFFLYFGIIGILIGVFVISMFGNFTVVFPIPYSFVLLALGINFSLIFSPPIFFIFGFWISVIAGLGAAIGETSAWLLGRSQASSIEELEMGEKMLSLKEKIEKGYGGLLIFLYAATPLPDDVLLIALGATKYKIWKALIWCFLGKVILCFISVYLGTIPLVQRIFGGTEPNPFMDTIWLIIGIAIILLIIYLPWDKYFGFWKNLLGKNKEIEETEKSE
ncbi:MAG: VTT domain-containing protein [Candidatus Helarchaeales archaeon]